MELKIKKTPKDLQKSKIFSNFAGDFRNKNYKKLFPKLSKITFERNAHNATPIMSYYNFLHEYRPCTGNDAGMVSMDDEQAMQVFKQYAEYGYIIVSTKSVSEIVNLLKQGKFSYMPVYAKIKNKWEKAMIIFNYHCGYDIQQAGDTETLKELLELGKTLTEQYHQDFFLYQEPGQALRCLHSDGSDHHFECDWGNPDSPDFNEFTKRYWVALQDRLGTKIKHIGISEEECRSIRLHCQQEIANKFVGCYINPAPVSDTERVNRTRAKEIFPTLVV